MENIDIEKIFKEEFDSFSGIEGVKKELILLVVEVMKTAPEYFFKNEDDGSENAIIAETKLSVKIANELFLENEVSEKFDNETRDLIRAALLLHDVFRYGSGKNGKVPYHEHPFMMAAYLSDNDKWNKFLPSFIRCDISNMIETHSGQWNTKEDCLPLKTPESDAQKFVHYCAFLAEKLYKKEKPVAKQDIAADNNTLVYNIVNDMIANKQWDGNLYQDQWGVFVVLNNNRVPVAKDLIGAFQTVGQALIHKRSELPNLSVEEFYKKYPNWNRMVYGNPNDVLYIMYDNQRIDISLEQAKTLGVVFK